jgi:hypothetical protein
VRADPCVSHCNDNVTRRREVHDDLFALICLHSFRRICGEKSARFRDRGKAGAAAENSLDEIVLLSPEPDVDLLALDEALERLVAFD